MTDRLSTSGRSRRGWALGAGIAALLVASVAIARLPPAPRISPGGAAAPVTTAGRLARVLEEVTFSGGGTGWATLPAGLYWRVVRTTDGGRRWRDVTPVGNGTNGGLELSVLGPDAAAIAFRPYAASPRSAFAVTTDSGRRWQVGVLPGAAAGPVALARAGSHLIAVLGDGRVVASSDGGSQWSPVALPATGPLACTAETVRFTSPRTGWIGSSCHGGGALWKTTDGGVRWRAERLALTRATAATCTVAAPMRVPGGPVLTTALTARGATLRLTVLHARRGGWTTAGSLALPPGRVVTAAAGRSVWAASLGTGRASLLLLYRSPNGGASWSFTATSVPAPEVTGIGLSAPGAGIVVGEAQHGPRLWRCGDSSGACSSVPVLIRGPLALPLGAA